MLIASWVQIVYILVICSQDFQGSDGLLIPFSKINGIIQSPNSGALKSSVPVATQSLKVHVQPLEDLYPVLEEGLQV